MNDLILNETVNAVAFVASAYVTGAALCRLGYGTLRPSWIWLYWAVFGNALWCLYDVLTSNVELKDMALAVVVAAYIWMTRPAWADGVPPIALKQKK